MERLIADFDQFSGAITKFLFLQRRLGRMSIINFEISLKFPHFLRSLILYRLAVHVVIVHSTSGNINLALFHLH